MGCCPSHLKRVFPCSSSNPETPSHIARALSKESRSCQVDSIGSYLLEGKNSVKKHSSRSLLKLNKSNTLKRDLSRLALGREKPSRFLVWIFKEMFMNIYGVGSIFME